ncbi:MAG TPA: NifU family protein [Vicinamibacterales bacterium]|nr:NifU family protein [Vicinamibacterales bacterium]
MISRDQVEVVVARIRPFIQSDGGDIELVDVAGNKATVRMSGNCVGCPSASMTLFMGLEQTLRDEVPGFEELVVV